MDISELLETAHEADDSLERGASEDVCEDPIYYARALVKLASAYRKLEADAELLRYGAELPTDEQLADALRYASDPALLPRSDYESLVISILGAAYRHEHAENERLRALRTRHSEAAKKAYAMLDIDGPDVSHAKAWLLAIIEQED